ncbi:hypothetical protein NKH77_20570 [Streptomyces sp. M19]
MGTLLLSSLGNGLCFPFTAIYVSELLGLGSGGAGGYFIAMAAASFAAALVGGPLADRAGPHRVCAVGGLALCAGTRRWPRPGPPRWCWRRARASGWASGCSTPRSSASWTARSPKRAAPRVRRPAHREQRGYRGGFGGRGLALSGGDTRPASCAGCTWPTRWPHSAGRGGLVGTAARARKAAAPDTADPDTTDPDTADPAAEGPRRRASPATGRCCAVARWRC